MKVVVLQAISWIALLGTVLPSILFYYDKMGLDTVKTWMGVMTLVWFVITPLWMDKQDPHAEGTETVP